MSRIEKNAPVTKQLEEMKGSVMREVREKNRKRRPMLTCGLVLLFFVVCFFGWTLWLIAATGLVSIPLLTSLSYETHTPLRVVESGTPAEVIFQEQLMSELTARLQSGNGEIENRSLTLTLSEESFTASLRSFIEESAFALLDASSAQLALDPLRGAELFVPLLSNPRETAIMIDLAVGTQNGNVTLTPSHIRLGNLNLPRFIFVPLLQSFFSSQVQELNEVLTGYARVDSVTIAEGMMTLVGEISVEVQ